METRLPGTLSVSLALHAAGLVFWLHMGRVSRHPETKVLSDVELLITVKPAPILRPGSPRAPMPPSTWNFLKMALPSVPARAPLDAPAPSPERRPSAEPIRTLEENKGRLRKALGFEPEKDLGRRAAAPAPLDGAGLDVRSHRPRLAEAPRLEEAPAARAPDALSRLSELLPSEPSLPRAQGGPPLLAGSVDIPAPERGAAEPMAERKRAVTIEGPLKARRIVHYELPKFPAWAQAQGVLEAAARIRFTVAPSGEVLEGMRLERTSGYGELDRLAMESLRRWRFEPRPAAAGDQWGIVTFRFVME